MKLLAVVDAYKGGFNVYKQKDTQGVAMGELEADTDIDVENPKVQQTRSEEFTLEQYLNKQQLEEIHKIFENAHKSSLKKAEFRTKILSRYKINISDEDFEVLFTKLDYEKTDVVSWDEFVTYLILELECKEKEANQSIIENPIVSLPQVINSGHRSAIIEITYSPSVRLNGTIDHEDGKYLSLSKDGHLNVWSPDLKLLRTYRDKSLYSTVKNTMVTNFVCLPDLNMLVTSSTELELRFYSMTSKRFTRVLVFQSMPFCVSHMYYHFTENVKEESMLICGDLGGNLQVMQFPKEDKGPFKLKLGVETMVLKWDQVLRGKLPLMKAHSILKVHPDWVKQVAYYKLLGSFVSCASCPIAMILGDIHCSKTSYVFNLKRGIDTFCVCEENPLIATGSMDCILRLWNPFITTKPISLLRGHHARIVKIFLQDQGRRVFSLDKSRVIRVWESSSQTCLQVYTGFTLENGPMREFSAYYNERNHLLIVGGLKIASATCGKLVDELRSDGKTQADTILVVLYNKLFKSIITCGSDSNIVIWDLRTNKSKGCIRTAHSSNYMGVLVPLPITAATFDPPHYFLLTGSTDGSIKMWDFNSGICLRNMDVGKNQEVTRLIWLKGRILAVGWNCRVVEFADSLTGKVTAGKAWELRHTNDILSADYRPGQALATGTYNGDLIVWRLETGQSYKRYNVTHPTGLLKLKYIKEKMEKKTDAMSLSSKSSKTPRGRKERGNTVAEEFSREDSFKLDRLKEPVRTLLAEKVNPSVERNLAVHCLIFLRKRETLPDQATLLTATENGMIQAWSHHASGSFIKAFKAVHMDLDYVVTMTTDDDNEFLFTGTVFGYIKIWLMKDYCLSASAPEVHVCMPRYRLQFPFLINDRIRTRVKAACKNQPKPLLLSSYKGHLKPVMTLTYIQECKIVLTGSADKTARVWTLSGRYIGTLGQNKPWLNIEWGEDPEKTNASSDFRVPPDLVRTASYTTMKVLRGAPPMVTKENIKVVDLSISEEEKRLGTYGEKLYPPYLGINHEFPKKTSKKRKVQPVDVTMLKIPVFVRLIMSQWKPISRVQTPECIQQLKDKETSTLDDSSRSISSQNRETSESYVVSWKIVAEKVEQILNPDTKIIVTFEPLYSRVYRNVCNGFSEQMHLDLIALCSKHLQEINQRLCSHDEVSTEHLLSVHRSLRAYLLSVRVISSIFSYMNKFYVAYCLNADLFIQLAALFSQIVISERISALMGSVEEALKTPFSISPEVLHNFFNELHQITNGEYSVKYLHLFSRYCPNVVPPMKESDLESHIAEVVELKKRQRQCQVTQERQGVKRPAEEQGALRLSYCHRQPTRTFPLLFH